MAKSSLIFLNSPYSSKVDVCPQNILQARTTEEKSTSDYKCYPGIKLLKQI